MCGGQVRRVSAVSMGHMLRDDSPTHHDLLALAPVPSHKAGPLPGLVHDKQVVVADLELEGNDATSERKRPLQYGDCCFGMHVKVCE